MNLKEVLKILIHRFDKQKIDFVLSGGLALSTMNIFRFTKDIDLLIFEESREAVHEIMIGLGYVLQDFSTNEIMSYLSPVMMFAQADFLLARRKYTRAMMHRALEKPIFDGEFQVKTLRIEDLIGLKIQAISNDPENRYLIDAPDIQRLLSMHHDKIDLAFIREYFRVFNKEDLLDEWLDRIK
jgi:predicted nucleotidyltransferase